MWLWKCPTIDLTIHCERYGIHEDHKYIRESHSRKSGYEQYLQSLHSRTHGALVRVFQREREYGYPYHEYQQDRHQHLGESLYPLVHTLVYDQTCDYEKDHAVDYRLCISGDE